MMKVTGDGVLREGNERFVEIIRRPLLIKGMRRKFEICCENYNKMPVEELRELNVTYEGQETNKQTSRRL
jgi:hypothetical protein